MSAILEQAIPITPQAIVQPSLAPIKADGSESVAQKLGAFDVMKDARLARSISQRKLLRQFLVFLHSRSPLRRLGFVLSRNEVRVAEASVRRRLRSRTPSPYYSPGFTHTRSEPGE